jgi:hypothetical protein
MHRKRPSAIESMPDIVKEPFPEAASTRKMPSIPVRQLKLPTKVRNHQLRKEKSVQDVIENRHETLKEAQELDKEIASLKKSRMKTK